MSITSKIVCNQSSVQVIFPSSPTNIKCWRVLSEDLSIATIRANHCDPMESNHISLSAHSVVLYSKHNIEQASLKRVVSSAYLQVQTQFHVI